VAGRRFAKSDAHQGQSIRQRAPKSLNESELNSLPQIQAIQLLQLTTSKEIMAGADSFVCSVSGSIQKMMAVEVPSM